MIDISAHACQRYVERVAPAMSLIEAAAEIRTHARAIECAARFGCSTVRLGSGVRLQLSGYSVVTVLPARAGRRKNAQIMAEEAGL